MSRNTIEIKYYLGKHWSHGDWLSIMLKIASDGSVFLYSIKGKKVQCISYLHHVFLHTFQFSTWLFKFAMYNWWIHQRCCQSKEIWHNFWWQHQHVVHFIDSVRGDRLCPLLHFCLPSGFENLANFCILKSGLKAEPAMPVQPLVSTYTTCL